MATGLNNVFLIRNLGADPDLRYSSGGKAVCDLRIATNEFYANEEHTEWHRVVVWDKLAERCAKFLRKSSTVHIEGSLRTRQWKDKEENKRQATEVVAFKVNFLANWGRGEHDKEAAPDGLPSTEIQNEMPF